MSASNIKIRKILFATDLSPAAGYAFKYAASLAGSLEAEVTVLHALEKLRANAELMLSTLLNYDDLEDLRAATKTHLMDQIRKYISGLCEDAACRMLSCVFDSARVIIEPGDPDDIILKYLESGCFDLLVIGNRGQGVVEEFFIGSTAHKVLRKSQVPVLVVPERV